jgi:hypothetical protein
VRVLAGLGSGSAARVRIWERRSWWRYRNERSTPGAGDRGDGYLVAVGAESVEGIDDFAAAAAVVAPRGDQRVRGLCCHGWSFKFGSSAGDGVVGRPRCTPWRVRRTIATASSICRRSLAESQMPQILIDIADDRHRPPMPGNRIDVLGNVHITPNVRDVHDRRMASDATVHNTWRLPREEEIAR